MHKLYEKNEILFSVILIIIYVVGASVCDTVSVAIGTEKILTFIFMLIYSTVLFIWMKKHGLYEKYGFCKPAVRARAFLYYIPLIAVVSCNLWFGVTMNFPPVETALYIGSMFCVGFAEEVIFRGVLFKAMCKDNVKSAIIVSSLTFGIGHMINLINGSGAEFLPNLCQVCYAIAGGFMFVAMFYKSKSLLACIIAHSTMNSLSAFSNEASRGDVAQIAVAVVITLISALYSVYIFKFVRTDK